MSHAADLRRLGRVLGLPVVAVRRTSVPRWGRLWAVQLDGGQLVALGHDRHCRDRRHLTERLAEVGAEPVAPISHRAAREVMGLLVRLYDEQETPPCTS